MAEVSTSHERGRRPQAALWLASAAVWLLAVGLAATDSADRDVVAVLVTGSIALASSVCFLNALRTPSERVGWAIIGVGKAGWAVSTAGYLANSGAVSDFPSAADVGLLLSPAIVVGFVLIVHHRLPGLPRALWLDAALGGFALAALGAAVLERPLLEGDVAGSAAAVGLLYGLTELFLAGFVAVGCLFAGWRRASSLVLLAAGALIVAVADGVYAVMADDGMQSTEPLVAAGWALGVIVISAASAFDPGPRREVSEPGWALLTVPVTAGLVALGIVIAHAGDDFSIAFLLSCTVALLTITRMAFSLVDNRRAYERRHREEEARHAREEAEQANRAKTEFLSRMSHEVRTPLNSILGFAQLLVDDLDGADRASVERILRAGNHLRRLIDDVLDLSVIESGQTAIALEPTPLGPTIDESIALLEPLARRTGARVVRHDADGAPEWVLADPQRLKQVLLNLISNAIKYGAAGGEVLVLVERDGPLAVVRVIDAGPGIPDEHMATLFTPFERGSARGSAIEGSGLGLALTKNLVEAMGGSIDVATSPAGSTFSIALPAAAGGEAGLRAPAPRAPAFGNGGARHTVLYVEDHPPNVALVERLLGRRRDFDLVTATTGRDGVELARRVRPDVILLDLDLPDMQGEAVLEQLAADMATADIPVIVVSADATARRQEQLDRAGVAAYVVKPIQLASFLSTLDSVLARAASARR